MKNHPVTVAKPYGLLLLILFFYGFFPIPSPAAQTKETDPATIKIGVLALRGKEKCRQQWTATADYLTQKVPGRTFTIVPLDFDELPLAVEKRQVDFFITNSSMYVSIYAHHGAMRIATRETNVLGRGLTQFGGVIFCRSDRNDIQSVADLRGKSFMAVDKKSFGGWHMAWRYLLDHDINPEKDLKELVFGGTHDSVVEAVLNKTVDAGTVRTSLLEQMVQEGKIKLDQFRVLDEKSLLTPDFPHLHSTSLYPEWPFAKTYYTDGALARRVAIALLQMDPDDPAAKAAETKGWTIPLNYQLVHDCLKRIKFDPYDIIEHITLQQMLHQYWPWLVTIALFLVLGCGSTLYFLQLNQRLRLSTRVLDHELAQRKLIEKNLNDSNAELTQILNHSAGGMRVINLEGEIINANSTFANLVHLPRDQFIGKKCHEIFSSTVCHTDKCPLQLIRNGVEHIEYETEKIRPDGTISTCLMVATPFYNGAGELKGIIEDFRDLTAKKEAEKEQHKLQSQLLHAQKLESVGQLAAGIAHEINTPTQYIGTNIDFLEDGFKDVASLISAYQRLLTAEKNQAITPALIQEIEEAIEAADWDYLAREIPLAITQSKDGVHRVSSIVRAMKEFSHPGSKEKVPVSLNDLINTTLTVSRNEWKYVADLDTDFADNLPQVPCLSDEMGQVFLNLLVNSAHAIATQLGDNPNGLKGRITISTRQAGDQVEVRVHDTGCGIAKDILGKVFDPFFTTKDVGKGTGQGLAIARDVIVNKHGGTLEVESEPGQGATFLIRLPLAPA